MNKHRAYCRILVLFSVVLSLFTAIPQGGFAQSQKGVDLFNSGKFQEAEKVFRESLRSAPSDTPTSFYLGLSVLLQKNYKDALDIFVKVKQSQDQASQRSRPAIPSEYQIQLALAQARIGVKQFDEAWKNLESARIEDNTSSDVYVYRGVYYLEQEKHEEAVKELEKAIKLDPKNPYAYYYSGIGYYHLGNAEEAVNDLKMFLQLDPDAPEAAEAKALVDKLC